MRCTLIKILVVTPIIVGFFPKSILAQSIVSYTSDSGIISLGKHAGYFEDKSNSLTIQYFLQDSAHTIFSSSTEEIPNFGSSTSTFWCRFTLLNKSGQDLYLEFRKALADEVEVFYQDSLGKYTSIRTGSNFPRSTRSVDDNYFIFQLPASNETETYFMKVKSVSNISFPLSIGSGRHLFAKHRDEEFLYGLYIGLILTLALYNFFVLLAVRDKNYLFYILYLLLNLAVYDLSAIGFGAEYIWRDVLLGEVNYTVTDVLVGLTVLINLLFLSSFLDLKQKLPIINRINQWFYSAAVLITVLNFLKILNDLPLTQLFIILSSLYILFVVLVAYLKNIKRSRFLLVGWSLYVLSIVIYELYILGILPYHGMFVNAIPVGTSFEALFFSFALADRIRELRNEKLVAQQQTLDLIKNQKEVLEKKVQERTMEIAAQNEEMVAQNEELVSLQDQLSLQNINLEKQNTELNKARKLIETQHQELQHYTKNLQEEVKMKAKDLVATNQELIKHNHQLQQFSFITAHNLRSPVARILGLINLLQLKDKTFEDREYILEQIRITGQDLDQVIKDLTLVLDIKKGIAENFKSLVLMDSIKRVETMLKAELEKNSVRLLLDVPADITVLGLSAYVESILFNLISNAIKYRSLDRIPTIEIRAQRLEYAVKISVSDNGIGIDLGKQQHKLFGMYQRFHFHVEGRGLGLHLVKTQTEAMGGKIDVTSEPHKGTQFEITLPSD